MAAKTLFMALLRSPAGPLLLAAQVSLSLMILANIAYVSFVRFETTGRPTGIDLQNIFWISSVGYSKDFNQQAATKPDLQYLNSLPGVVAASAFGTVPQTFDALLSPVSPNPELKEIKRMVVVYEMTERGIDTLGLRLVRGRAFGADAILPSPGGASSQTVFGPEVVITEVLADKLFGSGARALGKPLFFGILNGRSARIVGVVERMQGGPYFGPDSDFVNEVVLAPATPSGNGTHYIVRTRPGRRDAVMRTVEREFEALQPGRYMERIQTLAATAADNRADDRHSAVILAILSSFVLAVTMLGLFGFASFAVTTRTKEIGARRAFGATRADIVKHFLTENFLITTLGIAAGVAMTLAFALQLSMMLELPRAPIVFLAAAMALIWMTGLLAALLPALRGARVSPDMATRSV
jgi:putative ABC transport system permease protein